LRSAAPGHQRGARRHNRLVFQAAAADRAEKSAVRPIERRGSAALLSAVGAAGSVPRESGAASSCVCRMRVQTFAISLCSSRHDPQHHAH
jgi:hypothetical protein